MLFLLLSIGSLPGPTSFGVKATPIRSTAGGGGIEARGSSAYAFIKDAGASRLFLPVHADAQAASEALLHVERRDPRQCGVPRSPRIAHSSFFKPNQRMPTLCQPFSLLILLMQNNRSHFRSQPFLMARPFLRTAEHLSEPYMKERSFNAFFNALHLYCE